MNISGRSFPLKERKIYYQNGLKFERELDELYSISLYDK